MGFDWLHACLILPVGGMEIYLLDHALLPHGGAIAKLPSQAISKGEHLSTLVEQQDVVVAGLHLHQVKFVVLESSVDVSNWLPRQFLIIL